MDSGRFLPIRERYAKALDYFARSYAKLAALLEEEYIFNWLSWDGACSRAVRYSITDRFDSLPPHDKYRFKDVDRYSSSASNAAGPELSSRFLRKQWVSF